MILADELLVLGDDGLLVGQLLLGVLKLMFQ